MHRLISASAFIVLAALASVPVQAGEAEITLKHPAPAAEDGHKDWINLNRVTMIRWAPGVESRNVKVRGSVPRAGSSGLPTGKRQHKPFAVTKPVDKASPLLARALKTGAPLPRIVLMGQDEEGRALSVTLENVRIMNITPAPQEAGKGKGKPTKVVPTETISLNFEEIK